MFEKIVAWGKEHPYMLGFAVFGIGILLLWWFGFFSRGSSQSSAVPDYYAAQAAESAAAAGLAQSNNQTEAAIASIKGQTDIAGITAARDVQIAGLQRDVAINQNGTAQEIADTASANTLAATLAQFDYLKQVSSDAVTVNSQNTGAAVDIATANDATAVQLGAFNAATTEQATNAALQTVAINDSLAAYTAEVGLIENYNANVASTGNITGQGFNAAQPNSPPPYDASLYYTPTPVASSGPLPQTFVPNPNLASNYVLDPALAPAAPAPLATPYAVTSPVAVDVSPVSYPTTDPALVGPVENTPTYTAPAPTDLSATTLDKTAILYSPPPPPVPAPTVSYSGKV